MSMTGFGRGAAAADGLNVSAEIRSVNQRFLRVNVKLPPQVASLEQRAREVLEAGGRRGQLDAAVVVEDSAGTSSAMPDPALVKAYVEEWRKIARALKLPGEVDVHTLAAMPQLFAREGASQAAERAWPAMQKALKAALKSLDEMRGVEGRKLGEDLAARLDRIEAGTKRAAESAGPARVEYAKRLRDRVEGVLKELGAPVDAAVTRPNLEREIALHADRTDVSEEVERIESHVAQFRSTLATGSPAGRKLEFLIQELQREIGTLGAKVASGEAGCQAVELKSELEKMREQVQNVE